MNLNLKKRDMKREDVMVVGVIGLLFLGLILCAFGNMFGALCIPVAIVIQANNL
jgi:hypothetical protein